MVKSVCLVTQVAEASAEALAEERLSRPRFSPRLPDHQSQAPVSPAHDAPPFSDKSSK
jgi:hypothetical protein